MADKACLHGSDSPGLTRSISIPLSATENSCITHLAMNDCKTQLTLSVLVSRDSLWSYLGNIPACAASIRVPQTLLYGQREETLNNDSRNVILGSFMAVVSLEI